MLVLETLARRAASPAALQALMRNAEALVEGARSGGRLGYKRAAEAALAFPLSFRAAYFFYRRFGVRRFLADRLGDRFEIAAGDAPPDPGPCRRRRQALAFDLRRSASPRSSTAFSRPASTRPSPRSTRCAANTRTTRPRSKRDSCANRRCAARWGATRLCYEGGLIAAEVYRDLTSSVEDAQRRRSSAALRHRPRHAPSHRPPRPVRGPRWPAPRKRAEAAAAPLHRAERTHRAQGRSRRRGVLHRLGRGGGRACRTAAFRSAAAMSSARWRSLTGAPRQADVRALTYCRLLVLRKADFDRFMRDNRDVRLKIHEIAQERAALNRADPAAAL